MAADGGFPGGVVHVNGECKPPWQADIPMLNRGILPSTVDGAIPTEGAVEPSC